MRVFYDITLFDYIQTKITELQTNDDVLTEISQYGSPEKQQEFIDFIKNNNIKFIYGYGRNEFEDNTITFFVNNETEYIDYVGIGKEVEPSTNLLDGTDYEVKITDESTTIITPHYYISDVNLSLSDMYKIDVINSLGKIIITPPTDNFTLNYKYPDKLYYKIKIGFNFSYNFEIYSTNAISSTYLYYFLRYILITYRNEIQDMGFIEQMLQGQGFQFRTELNPNFIYSRVLTLTGKYFIKYIEKTLENNKKYDIIIEEGE